ncbi:hypothetical protein [Bacillus wiedmannii]|uniref:hypothetical protein n=1 Tax=Bacillus wiedmannii TaxID=1890302 RepID=UPI00197ADA1C|nr:hypothetical protein [Bacillus wiedmannii]
MQGSVNDATNKATAAEQLANEAKIKADTANNTSDSVQKQLDTIVINGDSSVEAAQARVDTDGKVHQVLKSRLDADYLKTIKVGNNQNRNLTADKPFLEIASVGGAAALHLTNGEGFTGPYILGIGKDAPGKGLELPNKANGNMITGTQRATVTDPNTYWMQLMQSSTTSPLVRLEQNVPDAAVALQLVANGLPTDNQLLMYVGDSLGEAFKIYAKDAGLKAFRNIELQDRTATVQSKIRLSTHQGAPADQRHNFFIEKQGLEWYNYSGSAGTWFPFSIKASGGVLNLSAGGSTNTVGTSTVTPIISIKNNMIGFFGATPVTKRTGVAVTPEAIHAALVSLGLISA